MDKSWIKLPRSSPAYLAGLNTFLDFAFSHACINGKIVCPYLRSFPRSIYILGGSWGATWYGIWAPSSSNLTVGNQVHQDDPVNEAVRDAFGVQDDNFTAEVQGPEPVFFRNNAAREFFSLMEFSRTCRIH
ncbi:hypothetical protein K1719_021647 [Acacia pycnantha]|nr:hypothetical protein K1719_021647 [Acacia pycnantha]